MRPCRSQSASAFADMCARGSPLPQVGSIGVVSATFGAVDAAQRLGIQRRVYTAGEAKVQLDPFLPVTPEQVGARLCPLFFFCGLRA